MFDRSRLRALAIAAILHCLLIVSLALADANAASPASSGAESIHRIVKDVITEDDIQQELIPSSDEPVLGQRWNLNLDWLRYPLWLLLGLGAVALLWQVVKSMAALSLPSRRAAANVAIDGVELRQAAPLPPGILPELEEILALARTGAYEAAVHLLLIRGLRQLDRIRGSGLAPSLTSREILRRPDLPAGSGTDLATLVQAVEISRFGGRPAGEAIFQSCLESYRRLVSAGLAAVPS